MMNCFLALVVLLVLTPIRHTGGQTTINPTPLCPKCRIELRRLFRVSNDSLSYQIGRATEDTHGRFYVLMIGPRAGSATAIVALDHQGARLYSVTRTGRGPGELGLPGQLEVLPGDSLLVFDALNGGIIFDPQLRYARTMHFMAAEAFSPIAVLPKTHFAFLALGGAPFFMQAVDSSWTPLWRKPTMVAPASRLPMASDYLVVADARGCAWAINTILVRFERFCDDKPPLAFLWDIPSYNVSNEYLRGAIQHVTFGGSDTMWLQRTAVRPGTPVSRRALRDHSFALDSIMDGAIEVIDIKTARVIATQTFPRTQLYRHGNGIFAVTRHEDANGEVTFDFYDVVLVRPK